MANRVKSPNLDENQRAGEALRTKKHPPLTNDLNYHVNDSLVKSRVHTAVLSSRPFNPLQNE